MNSDWFETLCDDRIEKCLTVLELKSNEYSKDYDRLHNFKVAKNLGVYKTNEQALWGMFIKHLVCLKDACDNPEIATEKFIDEKITDSINYLLLLEGLLVESTEKNLVPYPLSEEDITGD